MRILITLILFVAQFGTAISANAQEKNNTLLWRISGKGMARPSYLFGTMHLKARKLFNFPDSLYTALDNTDVFALEVSPDSMNAMISEMVNRSINKEDEPEKPKKKEKTLDDILTRDELRTLNENTEKVDGVNTGKLTLKQMYLMKDKLSRQKPRKDDLPTFMDAYLYTIAKDKGKAITGVERMHDQMDLVENLDLSDADPKRIVNYFNSGVSVQDRLTELYIANDLENLGKMSDIFPPEQEQKLLTTRNRNMLRSMDSIMQHQPLFCAVGALHLPGPRGLIALLREKGYTVEPVICESRTNAADYKFTRRSADWKDLVFAEDGYSVKMPGEPSDVNVLNGQIVMKLYYDVATSRCYATSHINKPEGNTASPGDLIDLMAGEMTKTAEHQDVKEITNGSLAGKEYLFNDKKGIYYHLQLLASNSDIYMLFAYAQSPTIRNADEFFQSFKLLPKTASKWVSKTFDDIRLTLTLPDAKPVRSVTHTEDSSGIQTCYTVTDAASGCYYVIVFNQAGKGFNYVNDSSFLQDVLTNLKKQDVGATVTEHYYAGNHAFDMVSSPFKGMRIKCRLTFCGNREYNMLAQVPDNAKCLADADSVLHSIYIIPPVPSAMQDEVGGSGLFATAAPEAFTEDTSGGNDTSVLGNRSFSAFDKSTLVSFDVGTTHVDKYYWIASDTAMFRKWFSPWIRATDSTPVYTYGLRCNGLPCAELTMRKKLSDQVTRVRMVLDGRTRYSLSSTFPSSMKDGKGVDSFFTRFRVLKRDTSKMQQSSALLFAHLQSNDSTNQSEAVSVLDDVTFSNNDIPALIAAITTPATSDTLPYYPNSVWYKLLPSLLRLADEIPMSSLEMLYSDSSIRKREQQYLVLNIIAARKDSVEAYKTIKRLLLAQPPRSGIQYTLTACMEKHPAMAKMLYPDLLDMCAHLGVADFAGEVIGMLLKTNTIDKDEFMSHEAQLINKSQLLRTNAHDYSQSVCKLLARIGTKAAWDEIRQYQFSAPLYDQYRVVSFLIDSLKQPDKGAVDSLAATSYYRIEIYSQLKEHGMDSLFPRRFLRQDSFAYSYLQSADEDGYFNSYVPLGARTIVRNGSKQKFFLYKASAEGDTASYLGVAGPFNTDSRQIIIGDGESVSGFYFEHPLDTKKLDDQLKLYLIKLKLDENGYE